MRLLSKPWPCQRSMISSIFSGLPLHPTRHLSLAYSLHRSQSLQEPQNAPIIILHGLFGSKQNNRSISKALARDLATDVYAVDLRNHGDSPHSSTHDYLSMAMDLEEFMNTNRLEKPTLIGHSMGAKVAMVASLRKPRDVSSVICVDNAPTSVPLTKKFEEYIYGMRAVLDARVNKLADADKILQKFEKAAPIRQFLLTNLTRLPGGRSLDFRIPIDVLADSLEMMGSFPFEISSNHWFDGPTLFIRGTKSEYVPDSSTSILGHFFPYYELKDVESGHWVISERPEAFKQIVVEFLLRHRI